MIDTKALLSRHGRLTMALLATTCGITVGNVYLCQPLLDQITTSMNISPGIAGLVAVGAQAGYALGILFVLPLADVVASCRLVRVLLLLTTLSLIIASVSPSVPILIAASVAVSSTTVIPQILIPIISGQSPPENRGKIIGTLQTGLILGILLSRTVSGVLAELSGSWRAPYILAAILTAILIFIIPRLLPHSAAPAAHSGYSNLLRSLLPLLKHQALRLSMALGFLVFAAFSAFWATLAFHLAGPSFSLGPATAGLFGLYGAPGAILAPRAGRLSDRIGSLRVNLFSLIAVIMAFILAGTFGAFSMLVLILAVNLLDFGLQSGQIANQVRIFALGDEIRARVNTLYMVATFGGGAVGSFMGTLAWSLAGWTGVCGLSAVLIMLAGLVLFMSHKPASPGKNI